MLHNATEEAAIVASSPRSTLAHEMAGTLWVIRYFIVALLSALAVKAAVMPAYAWVTGSAVAAARDPSATIFSVIAVIGPLLAAIVIAVALVEFGEKICSKAVEARLLLLLQRTYLARRKIESDARDVSQILYGADVARKGFEAAYKDSWRIPAEIIGVLVWQLTIGAEWVPLMLAAVIPALACVWLLGHRLQEVSRHILNWQGGLAATTKRAQANDFSANQERIFRGTIRFEILKWLTERGLDAALLLFLGLAVIGAGLLNPKFLPGSTEIAGAAAFFVNLRLLMKPLSDIGKVYTKWREALPAINMIYGLNPATEPESGQADKRPAIAG